LLCSVPYFILWVLSFVDMSLVREVNDYIDFLLWRDRHNRSTSMTSLDSTEMVESDFADYLANLEEYETRLANGEIKW
jgi:hypothetical protein